MKTRLFGIGFAGLVALLVLGLMPVSAATGSINFKLSEPAQVGGTLLAQGDYTARLYDGVGDATVLLLENEAGLRVFVPVLRVDKGDALKAAAHVTLEREEQGLQLTLVHFAGEATSYAVITK